MDTILQGNGQDAWHGHGWSQVSSAWFEKSSLCPSSTWDTSHLARTLWVALFLTRRSDIALHPHVCFCALIRADLNVPFIQKVKSTYKSTKVHTERDTHTLKHGHVCYFRTVCQLAWLPFLIDKVFAWWPRTPINWCNRHFPFFLTANWSHPFKGASDGDVPAFEQMGHSCVGLRQESVWPPVESASSSTTMGLFFKWLFLSYCMGELYL